MTIEQMADQARVTVTQHINRSAGQHLRAMRSHTSALDELYSIGCKYSIKDSDMRPLCESVGVAFDDLLNHSIGKPAPVTLAN